MTEVKDPGRGRLSPWSVALRGIDGLWGGLAMVLRHLGRRPVTEQYPDYKRFLPERTRARIVLDPGIRTARNAVWPAFSAPGFAPPVASPWSVESARMAAVMPPGFASILPAAFTAVCARRLSHPGYPAHPLL